MGTKHFTGLFTMPICIFGMGGIGGHCVAKLTADGHEISAVARGAHSEHSFRVKEAYIEKE
jgi:ketopantoate reductase